MQRTHHDQPTFKSGQDKTGAPPLGFDSKSKAVKAAVHASAPVPPICNLILHALPHWALAINAALLALAEAGARVGVCEDARVDGPIFDIVKGRVRDGESDLRDLEVRIGEGHRAILEPPILVLRELSLKRSKLETSAVSSTR